LKPSPWNFSLKQDTGLLFLTWLAFLLEELLKNGYLKEATDIFLKGAEGGYIGVDHLFDALVEKNADIGHHSNCIRILRFMEYMGRDCKVFHYNCLLKIEVKIFNYQEDLSSLKLLPPRVRRFLFDVISEMSHNNLTGMQANLGEADIALERFESMKYGSGESHKFWSSCSLCIFCVKHLQIHKLDDVANNAKEKLI
jgi:hypothetical protein